ncbi:MAG: dihydrolipoyl dehydrogenase [Bdellovibrionota bacterium]
MADTQFDLVIIGGGPGGYTGAIRAAQLGLKTAIVEKDKTLGGTCLNVGCIPSKALLDSSEHYAMAKHGDFAAHGLKISGVELDLPTMMARKEKIVKDLTGGVAFLMKKNKIEHHNAWGSVTGPNEVTVTGADGKSTKLQTKYIMIATGSVPIDLPFAKSDGRRVITSTEALSLPEVPKHLIVIGGGVIGLELGSVWLRLGAKVTVVEYAPMIAGASDQEMSKLLLRSLQKQGMEFLLSTGVNAVKVEGSKVTVSFEGRDDKKPGSLEGDVCLVAVGRKAFTDKLGLDKAGVKVDSRGRVEVDAHLRTNVSSIFAVGDAIAGPMLAHKAEEEGVAVAETIATGHGHVNYETVPSVIYTWPELASVGYTEEQLKEKGVEYRSGSFPFTANGRAKAIGMTDGKVKVLADAKTDRILGCHIVGPRASDVLAEAVIAMEFFGSSEDLARSFHGHPTLSEVLREAALAVDKRARQM